LLLGLVQLAHARRSRQPLQGQRDGQREGDEQA
jgi:hypothetical protein